MRALRQRLGGRARARLGRSGWRPPPPPPRSSPTSWASRPTTPPSGCTTTPGARSARASWSSIDEASLAGTLTLERIAGTCRASRRQGAARRGLGAAGSRRRRRRLRAAGARPRRRARTDRRPPLPPALGSRRLAATPRRRPRRHRHLRRSTAGSTTATPTPCSTPPTPPGSRSRRRPGQRADRRDARDRHRAQHQSTAATASSPATSPHRRRRAARRHRGLRGRPGDHAPQRPPPPRRHGTGSATATAGPSPPPTPTGRSPCTGGQRRAASKLPAAYVAEHLELGYAVTIHRSQGPRSTPPTPSCNPA